MRYYLNQPARMTIEVYDATGRVVRHLLDTSTPAGFGAVEWDGNNDAGNRVGQGVYFARLSAGGDVRSQRMITLE